MLLEFEWDSRDLSVWRDSKIEKALVRAVSRAGGDALRALRTESSKLIRGKKRFKASRVNKSLPLMFPRGAKDLGALEWRMKVSGKPVPVAEFPHSQTKKGVSVGINVGKRTVIKSAFIATLKSGHEGVFRRVGRSRLPIREAFTTRVSDVFQDADVIPGAQAKAQEKFKSAFSRLLAIELDKAH